MAHNCLVGGTAYTVTKGIANIGGTGYDVTKGRTAVGGTGYDISFVTATFDQIMADASFVAINGRNASSTSNVAASVRLEQTDTYYAFQFYNGFLTIAKVIAVYNGEGVVPSVTKTVLAQTGTNTYEPIVEGSVSGSNRVSVGAKVSADGSTALSVYGATMALLQFPNYPNSLVDKVLAAVTLTKIAGRNSSSTAAVGGTYDASGRWFAAHNAYMGYSSPLGTVIMGNHTTNPSLLYINGTTVRISTTGTSNTSVYGGSVVAVTE